MPDCRTTDMNLGGRLNIVFQNRSSLSKEAVLTSTYNLCFGTKIRKIGTVYLCIAQFCFIKRGLWGYSFHGHIFLMSLPLLAIRPYISRQELLFLFRCSRRRHSICGSLCMCLGIVNVLVAFLKLIIYLSHACHKLGHLIH